MILATFAYSEDENGMCKDGKDEYCAKCVEEKCTVCHASVLDDATGQCKGPTTEIENCVSYSSVTACSTCMLGYSGTSCAALSLEKCLVLNATDSAKCMYCEGLADMDAATCPGDDCTIENCWSCSGAGDAQVCNVCKSGYEHTDDTKKSCKEVTTYDTGCTTSSGCTECAYGYYVNTASTVTPMTCAESSRYSSVAVISGAILSWFAFMKF